MMNLQFLAVAAVCAMFGVTSAASQESDSPEGADLRLARAVDFLKQVDREILKLSNETDSSETKSSETDSNETEEYDCQTSPCAEGNGRFCGTDGQCHLYSCEEWYKFGRQEFTGYREDVDLDCHNIDFTDPYQPNARLDMTDVYYPSVAFKCESLTPQPIAMGFNVRCYAKSGPHRASDFTCYELKNNTNFQSFLNRATPDSLECPDAEKADGFPKFTYPVTTQSSISSDGRLEMHEAFDATDELDETRATTSTMFAMYEEILTDQPTKAPTAAPTTRPPTAARTAAAPIQTVSSAFLVATFVASLVHL